jgi:hypothetical protein
MALMLQGLMQQEEQHQQPRQAQAEAQAQRGEQRQHQPDLDRLEELEIRAAPFVEH